MNSYIGRSDVFPIEKLPIALQTSAEQLLLQLLDSEALYTLVGALKPLSLGTHSIHLDGTRTSRMASEGLSRLIPALQCGDVETKILPRKKLFGTSVYVDLAIYSQQGVARIVKTHSAFFATIGITPTTAPLKILQMLEKESPPNANRGLGYLYGYPAYAVEDFCNRRFGKKKSPAPSYFEVPTFSGKFAYPAPRGEKARLEDVALRESARVILAEYKRRRSQYIGDRRRGPVELVRDWFDNGNGQCSPENARYQ